MTEQIGVGQDLESHAAPDPLRGAKTLHEYAGKTFSGGTIMPGDPTCSLLDPALVNRMMQLSEGIRYDVRGTIIGRIPVPNENRSGI